MKFFRCRIFFLSVIYIILAPFALANDIHVAKVYRDYPGHDSATEQGPKKVYRNYPGYIQQPVCTNPRMKSSYAEQSSKDSKDDLNAKKLVEKLEAERLAAEKLEAERLAAEKAAAQKLEAERLAAEKAAAEKLEAERLAAEKVAAQKLEAEKLAAEKAAAEKLEAEKLAAEKAAAEKLEAERLAAEKAAAEKFEAERLAAEKAAAEKLEAGKLAAEKAAAQKLEAEQLAAEKAAAQKLEAERLAAEKAAAQKLEAERLAAEKAAAEKLEAERLAAEKAAAQKLEAEKLAAEKAAAEKLEAEKLAAEKVAAEKLEAERLAAEKAAAEKLEAERLAAEKAAAEKLEAEKLAAEKVAAEKLEAEKLAAHKAAAQKLEAERLAAEKRSVLKTSVVQENSASTSRHNKSATDSINKVSSLNIVNNVPGQVLIELNSDVDYRYFTLDDPPRLVVDVYGKNHGLQERVFHVNEGFDKIRIGTYDNKVRFVFDADGSTLPEIKVERHDSNIKVSWNRIVEDNTQHLSKQEIHLQPHFPSFVATLQTTDLNELEHLVEQLKSRKLIRVDVVGHADNLPIAARSRHIFTDNLALSEERARNVAEYLQQHLGVPPEAITLVGLGDSMPMADNTTETGRALNRRVEIFLVTEPVETPNELASDLRKEQREEINNLNLAESDLVASHLK